VSEAVVLQGIHRYTSCS